MLKKSFNLKLFKTKSVQIATFVGLGGLIEKKRQIRAEYQKKK